ncbi:MAG: TonB-dependent receptor, partial [Candidatus Acidiferrales bacterium]
MNLRLRFPSRHSAGLSNPKFFSRASRAAFHLLALTLACGATLTANPQGRIAGKVTDPQNVIVAGALSKLVNAAGVVISEQRSDAQGKVDFQAIAPGEYQVSAEHPGFVKVIVDVSVAAGQTSEITIQFTQVVSVLQSITVVASSPSVLAPDPSQVIVIHDQVLDANPGRPGAPISIPGLPIETASGGIKAPQYFAPGVAGDHGEPIAQFFQIGNFLFPNNLPANAHGNGYADPNFLVPPVIEAVTVDGGAFNVREGNNAVNLAASYVPTQRLNDFVQLTGDYRDVDVVAGWSPQNSNTNSWVAAEASYGNGFLERLEHRQQYKLNGSREFNPGRHQLTVFGLGYYGFSFVPGLIPIGFAVPNDTIDNRQLDRTHNFLVVATDNWKLSQQRQLSFSAFFRNYALTLRSNFGAGLIQQSEMRNVFGGETTYIQSVRPWLSILAGVDLRRDAPRPLDLYHLDSQNAFQLVTSNNLTLSFLEPFVSIDGIIAKYLHYDAGFRQELVWMNNQDLIIPPNSFDKLATLTLPKATITFVPSDSSCVPTVAFSYGEAFHTEDPRIGTGDQVPNLLAPSWAYQLRISETIKQYQFNLTLKQVRNSQELAKIDPDTGLQENLGPSRNRVLAVSLQRNFSHGAIYTSYAQADARHTQTGEPVPEAPRFIWDTLGSYNRLPFHLQAKGEFEYVRAKPLGDGFFGVPVKEFRGALLRPFFDNRMSIGVDFLIASGYTGQTL